MATNDFFAAQGFRAPSPGRQRRGSPRLASSTRPCPTLPHSPEPLTPPHPPPSSSSPTGSAASSSEAEPVACTCPQQQPELCSRSQSKPSPPSLSLQSQTLTTPSKSQIPPSPLSEIQNQTQLSPSLLTSLFSPRPPPQPPWPSHYLASFPPHPLPVPTPPNRGPTRSLYFSFPPLPTPTPPPPPPPPLPWHSPTLSTLGTALAISLAALSSPPAESYQFPTNQAIHPVWNLASLWL